MRESNGAETLAHKARFRLNELNAFGGDFQKKSGVD